MSENTMDFVTDFDTKCAEDDASEYCVALREEQGSNNLTQISIHSLAGGLCGDHSS